MQCKGILESGMRGIPLAQEVCIPTTATEVSIKHDETIGRSCAINESHIRVKIPEVEVHKETHCYKTTESCKVCVCVCVCVCLKIFAIHMHACGS